MGDAWVSRDLRHVIGRNQASPMRQPRVSPALAKNESVNDRNRIEQSLESENESVDSVQSV